MNYYVDTGRLARAMDYWKGLGFVYGKVPLTVHPEIMDLTCPSGARDGRLTHADGSQFVASAEQSFLQLDANGKELHTVDQTGVMAITPCYRDESDETHLQVFLKLELFKYVNSGIAGMISSRHMASMAKEFFALEGLPTIVVKTDEGYDLMYSEKKGEVELGSYGVRETPSGRLYVYGTGIAEPRASMAQDVHRYPY